MALFLGVVLPPMAFAGRRCHPAGRGMVADVSLPDGGVRNAAGGQATLRAWVARLDVRMARHGRAAGKEGDSNVLDRG